MSRLYVSGDVTITLAATAEFPAGKQLILRTGWNEVTDEMKTHPMIARAIPQTASAEARQEKLFQAQAAHDLAVSEAADALTKVRLDCAAEEQAEYRTLEESYNERRAEAESKGVVFTEISPDPEAMRAIALTGPVPAHVATTQQNVSKIDDMNPPLTSPPRPRLTNEEEAKEEDKDDSPHRRRR